MLGVVLLVVIAGFVVVGFVFGAVNLFVVGTLIAVVVVAVVVVSWLVDLVLAFTTATSFTVAVVGLAIVVGLVIAGVFGFNLLTSLLSVEMTPASLFVTPPGLVEFVDVSLSLGLVGMCCALFVVGFNNGFAGAFKVDVGCFFVATVVVSSLLSSSELETPSSDSSDSYSPESSDSSKDSEVRPIVENKVPELADFFVVTDFF